MRDADFGGYVTRYNRKCTDGRTIMTDAFKHHDGEQIPLVWSHGHKDPENVLGHLVLEHRDDGVYGWGFFNETTKGIASKAIVKHKDVKALSIYANQLVQRGDNVVHGSIKEGSLVLAGANPGAFIDNIRHGDWHHGEVLEDEAVISAGEAPDDLTHADDDTDSDSDGDGETIGEIFEQFTEKQKNVVYIMLGQAIEKEKEKSSAKHSDGDDDSDSDSDNDQTDGDQADGDQNDTDLTHGQEGTSMTRNTFDTHGAAAGTTTGQRASTLTHDQLTTLVETGKRLGSFKDAVLEHAGEYGIENIEVLFPDAQAIDNKPEWITRKIEWVEGVLNQTRKLPFSKVKSLSADLTHEEARAKGYIKGDLKKEQFFRLSKRETGPKTIYKKQKLDRDDITDITEFDVVAWIWVEMRFMLRAEIARAILIGDGRAIDDPDKINEENIRPIATDHEFYTDVVRVSTTFAPLDLVEAVLRGREHLKGLNVTAYMAQKFATDMLLVRDGMNRRMFRTLADVAAELQVREIVIVPDFEGATRDGEEIILLLVNLSDYSVGSTRGGEISTFDQFDIDFNQHKYLIEGRMSGALTKHKTAQVVVRSAGTTEAVPVEPTFNASTSVVTIPTVLGVEYFNSNSGTVLTAGAQPALADGTDLDVSARPAAGYHFPAGVVTQWTFVNPL